MKSALCSIHGPQGFIQTSPLLVKAIGESNLNQKMAFRELVIQSNGNRYCYLVDADFLASFGLSVDANEVTLHDRSREKKQLNDRILIQRITGNMAWVCQICLSSLHKESRAG